MKIYIKNIIENIVPHSAIDPIKEWRFKIDSTEAITEWVGRGSPVPPPSFFKNTVIRKIKDVYKLDIFVETGTFLGNTTEIQRRKFKQVFSVELSVDLYTRAKQRFKQYSNVHLFQGDSATVLPLILKEITQPALFWLDAHYSGILGGEMTARAAKDCPIFEELEAIFNQQHRHVILVDDAREFTGQNGYPTLFELQSFISNKQKKYKIHVENDIIRIEPDSL